MITFHRMIFLEFININEVLEVSHPKDISKSWHESNDRMVLTFRKSTLDMVKPFLSVETKNNKLFVFLFV